VLPLTSFNLPSNTPPKMLPDREFTPLEVVGLEEFYLETGQANGCVGLIVKIKEQLISVSEYLWCPSCQDRIADGDYLVNHRRHVQIHLQRRGDPFSRIDTLWETPFRSNTSNSHQLVNIVSLLKTAVQESIWNECPETEFVNVAFDGWSDPTRRRYEGITMWLITPDQTTRVHLLVFKSREWMHETSRQLYRLISWLLDKYGIRNRLVNRCTACSLNLSHSRIAWNEIAFFGQSQRLMKPVFILQNKFHHREYLIIDLEQTQVPPRVGMSFSEVHWYSADDRFNAVNILWKFMVKYDRREKLEIEELNDQILDTIRALKKLICHFVKTQQDLESEEVRTGNKFAGHFMSVCYRVIQFATQFNVTFPKFQRPLDAFFRKYPVQSQVFIMLKFEFQCRD
jgi:hypothetical protein